MRFREASVVHEVVVGLEVGVVFVELVIEVVLVFLVELVVVVFEVGLEVDADLTKLRLEQLQELIDVVPAPLIDDVGQELEHVAMIETTFDLFDLFFRKRFENVFPKGLGIVFLDCFLRGDSDLTNRAPVEMHFHGFAQPVQPVCRASISPSLPRTGHDLPALGSPLSQGLQRRQGRLTLRHPVLALPQTPLPRPSLAGRFLTLTLPALLLLWPTPTLAQAPVGPSPTSFDHFQYGGALTAETVPSAGDVCPSDAIQPCILQGGGGLAIRAGYRSRLPWYIGGAYEFSRHDSSNLLVLPILQQIRAEGRYYWDRGQRLLPYGMAALGLALYGNEWGAETAGAVGGLGLGFEFQVTPELVVGGSLAYRPLLLRAWTDSAGQRRADSIAGFGLAHLASLELGIELRDPLPRW